MMFVSIVVIRFTFLAVGALVSKFLAISTLVFKSPVRSGLLPLRGIDRDRDQSTIIRDRQKTGPDRKKPQSAVFCGLLTGLRS